MAHYLKLCAFRAFNDLEDAVEQLIALVEPINIMIGLCKDTSPVRRTKDALDAMETSLQKRKSPNSLQAQEQKVENSQRASQEVRMTLQNPGSSVPERKELVESQYFRTDKMKDVRVRPGMLSRLHDMKNEVMAVGGDLLADRSFLSGHRYQNVKVGVGAKAQLGDVYYNSYYNSKLFVDIQEEHHKIDIR